MRTAENNTLNVNEICMEKEQLAKNSFSKRINDLITKETKEKLDKPNFIKIKIFWFGF